MVDYIFLNNITTSILKIAPLFHTLSFVLEQKIEYDICVEPPLRNFMTLDSTVPNFGGLHHVSLESIDYHKQELI